MRDMFVALSSKLQLRALVSIQSRLDVAVSKKKRTRTATAVLVRQSEPRRSIHDCIIVGEQKWRYCRGMGVCTLILNLCGSEHSYM